MSEYEVFGCVSIEPTEISVIYLQQGPDGQKGDRGLPGEDGAPGRIGNKIFVGEDLPNDSQGLDGDLYIRTNITVDVYQKNNGSYSIIVQLRPPLGRTVVTSSSVTLDNTAQYVECTGLLDQAVNLPDATTMTGQTLIVKRTSLENGFLVSVLPVSGQFIEGNLTNWVLYGKESLPLNSQNGGWVIL